MKHKKTFVEIAQYSDIVPSPASGQGNVHTKWGQFPSCWFCYINQKIIDSLTLALVIGKSVAGNNCDLSPLDSSTFPIHFNIEPYLRRQQWDYARCYPFKCDVGLSVGLEVNDRWGKTKMYMTIPFRLDVPFSWIQRYSCHCSPRSIHNIGLY